MNHPGVNLTPDPNYLDRMESHLLRLQELGLDVADDLAVIAEQRKKVEGQCGC